MENRKLEKERDKRRNTRLWMNKRTNELQRIDAHKSEK